MSRRICALEYVTTVGGHKRPVRGQGPWLPRLQCACWWAVAAFLLVALSCEFGRGW